MGRQSVLFYAFLLILTLLGTGKLPAQQNKTRLAYIEQYKNTAIAHMQEYGIPASITLAQACLESGDGTSRLAKEGNNHFGIKCHDWKGKSIYQDDDAKNECFRKYDKPAESFKDHAEFLRYRSRYAFLFDLQPNDYKAWAQGLKQAGYATNPQYANLLIKIIEDYQLYLYDQATSVPPSPNVLEQPLVIHPPKGSTLYTASLNRDIYQRNKAAYIFAQPGDSYASLAREFKLFTREILKYNELYHNQDLSPGTLVYVAQKRKQAEKAFPLHISEAGESLRLIAQRYGVRLSKLCKYNQLQEDDILPEGSMITLRRK